MALRNERLDAATLRPTPEERRKMLLEEASSSHGRGGGEAASDATAIAVPSSASVAVAAAAAAGVTTTNPSHSWTAIGRKLLTRRVAYASFDKLPDPGQFQLHPDLKGWKDSPSRLDFLYKELVRQRNAAVRYCSEPQLIVSFVESFIRFFFPIFWVNGLCSPFIFF